MLRVALTPPVAETFWRKIAAGETPEEVKGVKAEEVEPVSKKRRTEPRKPAEGSELVLLWGQPDIIGGTHSLKKGRPGVIIHAFNTQFRDIVGWVEGIAKAGFEALQISPAQRSNEDGGKWWMRYQPVRYTELHGLGDEKDLSELCATCEKNHLKVVGDLIFNHMLIVAPCEEWKKAQEDEALLEKLTQKLESIVGPDFDRNDFQWPWFPLEGEEWDGPRRMTGWGCGEWSKLKAGGPKVVQIQTEHLKILRRCGVSHFRLDAAKHMEPQYVANFASIAQGLPVCGGGGSEGTFFYSEVFTHAIEGHKEYQEAKPAPEFRCSSWDDDEPLPTTDVQIPVRIRRLLETGETEDPKTGKKVKTGTVQVPLVARNSLRFARNHDIAYGDQSVFGDLGNWAQESAALAAAMFLSVHDGTVLVLNDDAVMCRVVRDAAWYRSKMRKHLQSLPKDVLSTVATRIGVKQAEDGGAPLWICIVCRLQNGEGPVLGFAVLNPDLSEGQPTEFLGSSCLASSEAVKFQPVAGDAVGQRSLTKEGTLDQGILIPPGNGAFFLTSAVA